MDTELEELSKYQFPIVIIGNKMSDKQISSVYVDIEKAVYELTMNQLAKNKDRKVGIIQDRKNDFTTNQKQRVEIRTQ